MAVQVVVRAQGFIIAQRPAQQLQGPIGQHFVDVHVGRGAGAALQGVDNDVPIELSVDHLPAGRLDGHTGRLVPASQFVIGPRGGQLDGAIGMHQPAMDRPPGQRKVFDRPERVDPPQRIGRHFAASQQVGFVGSLHSQSPRTKSASRLQLSPLCG